MPAQTVRQLVLSLFAGTLFVGCAAPSEAPPAGGEPPANQGPAAGLTDEIFAKDPDELRVIPILTTDADGSRRSRDVPVNQIMLMFANGISRADATATLARMQDDLAATGLTLVGQVPDLGIYQLEIVNSEADPEAAAVRLEAVQEALRAYDGVAVCSYNELLSDRAIENNDDNSSATEDDRCAFAVIDYYQAIPIFDRVLPHVTLSDVTVAVIDSGLWTTSGHFDDILLRTRFPDEPTTPHPYDWHPRKHGTVVTSLIAADNGDGVMNGIASRVLGDRLHLIVGNAHAWVDHYDMAKAIASARQAVLLGADIVNISIGEHDFGNRPRWLLDLQAQFTRLFRESPNTLFIAAASNDGFVLNGNDAPAGLPEPNLLTVGGFQSCHFDRPYALSSTGPGVELAAPATDIPVCCIGTGETAPIPTFVEGNSYATPIVTAIAAIVRSIDPTLSGAALKAFLLDEDHTWPAPAEVGGRRIALIKTVGSALLNRAASSSEVDRIMDDYGDFADDIPDPSGHMANKLAGHIDLTVTGPGFNETYSIGADQITWTPATSGIGLIGLGGQVNLGVTQGPYQVTISTSDGFRLNEDYTIRLHGPNKIGIFVHGSGGTVITGIDDTSGSFRFTECELTTRSLPLDWYSPANAGPDQLVFIEVSGSFNGTNTGSANTEGEITHGAAYTASGEFTTAFVLINVDSDTMEELEDACVGGYEH